MIWNDRWLANPIAILIPGWTAGENNALRMWRRFFRPRLARFIETIKGHKKNALFTDRALGYAPDRLPTLGVSPAQTVKRAVAYCFLPRFRLAYNPRETRPAPSSAIAAGSGVEYP